MDPKRRTWVVSADGVLLRYAQVGPCKLPHPEVHADDGELYQLYVRRSAQGQGFGRLLLDVASDHLASAHPGPSWIGVGEYDSPVGSWMDHEFIFRRP